MTDQISVSFYTKATEYAPDLSGKGRPWLFIRCNARSSIGGTNADYTFQGFDVFINWDRYMGATSDYFRGKLRWNHKPPVDARWSESTNNKSTFLSRDQRGFVKNVMRHKTLLVRVWDYRGREYDAKFNIAGLNSTMVEHGDICRW